jgi:hypothetical protein
MRPLAERTAARDMPKMRGTFDIDVLLSEIAGEALRLAE